MSQDFQVVRGAPDSQELAAVIMVITAQAALTAQARNKREQLRNEWNAPHRSVRKSFEHGGGTWRRSALPYPY